LHIQEQIIAEVSKLFVGKSDMIERVLLAMLAGGHVLLEDIPGVGKTTLATAFSQALSLSCKRVQFTPDVMPADVTGFTMLTPGMADMAYRPGAVMCNLLLADEINRASARTQSALLEAMEENAVTVDGTTYALPKPFMVIATQNPAGSSGTQLLPESQTDRFMLRLSIGYPKLSAEMEMIRRKHGESKVSQIVQMSDAAAIMAMRDAAACVYLDESMYRYILQLCRATRTHQYIKQGVSPRCSAALTRLTQAHAFVRGRDYALPEDTAALFVDCASHRLILTAEAKKAGLTPQEVLEGLLAETAPPRLVKR